MLVQPKPFTLRPVKKKYLEIRKPVRRLLILMVNARMTISLVVLLQAKETLGTA